MVESLHMVIHTTYFGHIVKKRTTSYTYHVIRPLNRHEVLQLTSIFQPANNKTQTVCYKKKGQYKKKIPTILNRNSQSSYKTNMTEHFIIFIHHGNTLTMLKGNTSSLLQFKLNEIKPITLTITLTRLSYLHAKSSNEKHVHRYSYCGPPRHKPCTA